MYVWRWLRCSDSQSCRRCDSCTEPKSGSWFRCVLICHQQKRTFGGWRTSSRDLAYFRVSYDILRSSWKRSSPCVPTTMSLSGRAKAFTLKGRHRRFVGDSAFHTSLRGAPLLVGGQHNLKWYYQILQKVQNLMPHDYVKSCTVYIIVYQYVLVDYCCFHLTSGASTAVGPYIINRNRKRFFLSQSTLRERVCWKKVPDVWHSRPSNDSSPCEPLFPGGASLKVVEFWSQ